MGVGEGGGHTGRVRTEGMDTEPCIIEIRQREEQIYDGACKQCDEFMSLLKVFRWMSCVHILALVHSLITLVC